MGEGRGEGKKKNINGCLGGGRGEGRGGEGRRVLGFGFSCLVIIEFV